VFPLYCVVDSNVAAAHGYDPVDLARRFLDGGARLLQLRAKDAPDAQLLAWADAIGALARGYGAAVVINDRADIALMAGAAGVHVGQDDLPPSAVRRLLPAPLLVGRSTHTAEQIAAAAREPIDYLAAGPVFGTATKDTGYAPIGLRLVEAAARNEAGLPVVAIGGITVGNAAAVRASGAASVAVISDLLSTGDPAERVREYLRVLAGGPGLPHV
jgi:thiamine-phosphate pyrophosphorylase